MKKLLGILVLVLILITPSQADDIRDFQIEGITIGDSLLNHFTEEELKDYKFYYPASKKFVKFQTFSSKIYKKLKKLKTYKVLEFHYKNNDSKYIISSIGGAIFYRNNMKDCYKKKNEIVSELSELFINTKSYDNGIKKHIGDKSGKSTTNQFFFRLESGDTAKVSCFDWSKKFEKERGFADHLKVGISDEEYKLWLRHEAYK